MEKICRNKPARIGMIALIATAAIVVFGLIVMLLWNALLPALLKLPVIGFWQAVGLLILARILFGHHGRPGRGAGRWQWKQRRFFEKWEKMTPEAEFELLKLGYLYVRYKDRQSQPGPLRKRLLNLSNGTIHEISIGQAANFVLNENGKARYAVINGYLVDLDKPMPVLPNTYGY